MTHHLSVSSCRHELYLDFTEEEFAHNMLDRDGVINSFVVDNMSGKGKHKLEGFASFYHLPSSVMKHKDYKMLNVAYSFYHVTRK